MTEFEKNHNTEEKQDEFCLVKHSVKHKRAERKIRKKRKKVNRIKRFLRFLLCVLLIFSSYEIYKLSGWYLPSDTFTNPTAGRIEIINNKIVPTYVINNFIKKVPVSKLPIFLTDVKPVKKEVFKIPVIKNVYVRRYGFPARLQIIVRERTPIAVIKSELGAMPAAFFTSDGVLVTNRQYMNLPNKENILVILSKTDNLSKNWTMKRVQDVEKIVKDVETYSNEKVEYIDMRNPNDVYVKIPTINIRLGALDSTVPERIKRIYTILPQITKVDSQIMYIDLSWDKVNYLKLNKSSK